MANNMISIFVSIFFRFISIFPLSLIFITLFKTYWEKINTINGLRKTRVVLMVLVVALLIDQLYFMYLGITNCLMGNSVIMTNPITLFLDKGLMTLSFYGLFYLFRHASHNNFLKEKNDKHS